MEKWISYAVISMLFAELTSVIAKFGLKNVSGDTGLSVRTIVVFILIWANALFFQDVSQFRNLDKSAVLFWPFQVLRQVFHGSFTTVP